MSFYVRVYGAAGRFTTALCTYRLPVSLGTYSHDGGDAVREWCSRVHALLSSYRDLHVYAPREVFDGIWPSSAAVHYRGYCAPSGPLSLLIGRCDGGFAIHLVASESLTVLHRRQFEDLASLSDVFATIPLESLPYDTQYITVYGDWVLVDAVYRARLVAGTVFEHGDAAPTWFAALPPSRDELSAAARATAPSPVGTHSLADATFRSAYTNYSYSDNWRLPSFGTQHEITPPRAERAEPVPADSARVERMFEAAEAAWSRSVAERAAANFSNHFLHGQSVASLYASRAGRQAGATSSSGIWVDIEGSTSPPATVAANDVPLEPNATPKATGLSRAVALLSRSELPEDV